MRSLLSTLTLVAAVLVAVPAAGPANAVDGPMCQGQPATLVGSGGVTVEGTEGPDVIVSNGSSVQAHNGDDIICMTEVTGSTYVATDTYDETYQGLGNGDDSVTVDSASPDAVLTVYLYAGDDTFVGGPERDVLLRKDPDDVTPSGGDDVIRTGGGDDVVEIGTDPRSRAGLAATDRVDLGAGDDVLRVLPRGLTQARSLVGGAGHDTLFVLDGSDGLDIDARHRVVRSGDESFSGYQGFETYRALVAGPVSFVGSARAETLRVSGASRVHALLGGGRDLLATSNRVGRVYARGEAGNDVLFGAHADDTLLGGRGFDTAHGRGGRDACVAERERACERR
ncbi:hypothetical protein BH11ACT8_BH11ACT8_21550 [soil metagenome]